MVEEPPSLVVRRGENVRSRNNRKASFINPILSEGLISSGHGFGDSGVGGGCVAAEQPLV